MSAVLLITSLIILILILRLYNGKQVIWFYRPDCGYCANMMDTWSSFEKRCYSTIFPPLSSMKININEPENAELVADYNITSVPHIIKLERGGLRKVYNGDRSYGDLLKWAQN